MLHIKCRNSVYPSTNILRFFVPDHLVSWEQIWPDYKPVSYTSEHLINQVWADPEINSKDFNPKWNAIDNKVNRISYTAKYIISNQYPLNPCGRTGLIGRGKLGRWGPNHAADPIVTRWKIINSKKNFNEISQKPILQFVGIQRRDNGEWAIPGGMVDLDEHISSTLKREFMEETMNCLEANEEEKHQMKNMIDNFFSKGMEIYKGYVDDPRNTDNAWMETVAYNFHDENCEHVGKFNLNAGDDAKNVKWIDIDGKLPLYASHIDFLRIVANNHNAHW